MSDHDSEDSFFYFFLFLIFVTLYQGVGQICYQIAYTTQWQIKQ